MSKKKHSVLLDVILTILTGGLWLIVVAIRYMNRRG
jgi:hypothetical protein